MHKPLTDDRIYRHLLLPNELEVLLIADPPPPADGDASAPPPQEVAWSMQVGTGSFHDQRSALGLAHYVEHLFVKVANEKFPDEDEFDDFVVRNGGQNAAHTGYDFTNYRGSLPSPKALLPSLERLAERFISSTFTDSLTEREINSIHAEFVRYLVEDGWRKMAAINRELLHPDSVHNWFHVGNEQSLKAAMADTTRSLPDLAKTFVQRFCHPCLRHAPVFYSPNLAKLVVLSSGSSEEDLDALEAAVRDRFEKIPNNGTKLLEGPDYREDPDLLAWAHESGSTGSPTPLPSDFARFTTPENGRVPTANLHIQVVPTQDFHCLTFMWPIDDSQHPSLAALADYQWESKPFDFLSGLIGHEGEGSLHSELSLRRNLVSATSAGLGSMGSYGGHPCYQLSFTLTNEAAPGAHEGGLEEYERGTVHEIAAVVAQYLAMLRREVRDAVADAATDNLRPLWDEARALRAATYKYQPVAPAADTALHLSERLLDRQRMGLRRERVVDVVPPPPPISELLAYDYLYYKYSSHDLQAVVDFLSDAAGLVLVSSSPFFATCPDVVTEQWFGASYRARDHIRPETLALFAAEGAAPAPNLHLPPLNPFVPTDVTVVPRPAGKTLEDYDPCEPPVLIEQPHDPAAAHPLYRVYFKPENFDLPKADVNLRLYSGWVAGDGDGETPASGLDIDARNRVSALRHRREALLSLWVGCFLKEVNESLLYPAAEADLTVSVSPFLRGLDVAVGGFSQKLPLFLSTLTAKLVEYGRAGPSRVDIFNQIKDLSVRVYKTALTKRGPMDVADELVDTTLLSGSRKGRDATESRAAAALRVLEGIAFEDVRGLDPVAQIATGGAVYVEGVAQGNFAGAGAVREMVEGFMRALFRGGPAPFGPRARLPSNLGTMDVVNSVRSPCVVLRRSGVDPDNRHNVASLHVYVGGPVAATYDADGVGREADLTQKALTAVIGQMISKPFFNELLGKQQLGYIVWAYDDSGASFPAGSRLKFIVESETPAEEVKRRIDAFIRDHVPRIFDLPAASGGGGDDPSGDTGTPGAPRDAPGARATPDERGPNTEAACDEGQPGADADGDEADGDAEAAPTSPFETFMDTKRSLVDICTRKPKSMAEDSLAYHEVADRRFQFDSSKRLADTLETGISWEEVRAFVRDKLLAPPAAGGAPRIYCLIDSIAAQSPATAGQASAPPAVAGLTPDEIEELRRGATFVDRNRSL